MKALRIPNDTPHYQIRYPIQKGILNRVDYHSIQELIGDLTDLWRTIFKEELNIEPNQIKDYYAVLVLPDTFHRPTATVMVQVLLQYIGIHALIVTQASDLFIDKRMIVLIFMIRMQLLVHLVQVHH
jgi:hypothetical protein